jgi:hypothetical protein
VLVVKTLLRILARWRLRKRSEARPYRRDAREVSLPGFGAGFPTAIRLTNIRNSWFSTAALASVALDETGSVIAISV